MTAVIAVAGATGNLGGRIVRALRARGAEVRALVRPTTPPEKRVPLEAAGAAINEVELGDAAGLRNVLTGVECVISALQGLRETIVDAQTLLLEGALATGVPRFIPSDYAADLFRLEPGENRNFDLRREFHAVLDKAPIRRTSILNGGFMELLARGMPLFDPRAKSVSYYGDPDQKLDYTTMDDTAAVTAAAALDPNASEIVRVAGDSLTARELAELGRDVSGAPFALVRAGSIDDLAAFIARERAAHPEGEDQTFPRWQQLQYTHNMQSGRGRLTPLDNARYPDIRFTKVRDVLMGAFGPKKATGTGA